VDDVSLDQLVDSVLVFTPSDSISKATYIMVTYQFLPCCVYRTGQLLLFSIERYKIYLRDDVHALSLCFLVDVLAQLLSACFDGSRGRYSRSNHFNTFCRQCFTDASPVL
jgi:hypothetical protein